jgi:hypothetical protein
MKHLSANDMIFYKEDGKMMSGGFSVESLLLKNGKSPIKTLNGNGQEGGDDNSVAGIFKNMAVPSTLLYQPNREKTLDLFDYEKLEGGNKKTDDVLPEDIHEKFMKMIEVNGSGKTVVERKTRKQRRARKNNNSKKQ